MGHTILNPPDRADPDISSKTILVKVKDNRWDAVWTLAVLRIVIGLNGPLRNGRPRVFRAGLVPLLPRLTLLSLVAC